MGEALERRNPVTPEQRFSSSPLWTALIALCFRLFGVYPLVPLFLNILIATATVCISYFLMIRRNAPAATLALFGLEHNFTSRGGFPFL